jgi:hypothetical protein
MSTEHWFDRLTVRLTRRQALKAAAGVTGTALAWPLLRNSVPAGAGTITVDDCFKGCTWTAYSDSQAAAQSCANKAIGTYLGMLATSPLLAIGALPLLKTLETNCLDSAVLQQKADYYDCMRPNCNGFDPKEPGGPCDGCKDNCCTCAASANGYICCVFQCDDEEHSCCPT